MSTFVNLLQAHERLYLLIRKLITPLLILLPITVVMIPKFVDAWSGIVIGDTLNQFLPYKSVALEAIRSGEVPLWNPYLFSGSPMLADPQNSLLYPSQIFFFFLQLPIAFAVTHYVHVFILAFGTYKLLRLYCDQLPSLAGTFAFTFSGSVFVRAAGGGGFPHVQTLAWIPWIFFCLESYWFRRNPLWMIACAVVIAMQVMAGFPTFAFYTMLTVGIYLLYRLVSLIIQRRWRFALETILWGSIMFLIAAMVSAVQWLPTAEFISLASRARPDIGFVQQNSMPVINIITSILPELFGSALTQTAIQETYWAEHNIYIGGLSVILALLYVVQLRNHKNIDSAVYLLLTIVSLIIAFGAHNPAYIWLFNHVPGFSQLADPGRMTILFAFFLSIVSALGVQYLADWLPTASTRIRSLLKWSAIGLSLCLLCGLLILTFGRDTLTVIAEPMIQHRYGPEAIEKLQELDTLYNTQILTISIFLGVSLAASFLIYLRMHSRLSARRFILFCLLIIIVDVGFFALRMTSRIDLFNSLEEEIHVDVKQSPAYLTTFNHETDRFRVLPLNSMAFNNQGSQYRLSAITGYNPLILKSYMQLLGVIRDSPIDPADRVPMITSYNSPLLKLLNVKYLVSYELLQDEQLDLVYKDYPYVYELNQPENAAFMVYHAEFFENDEQVISRINEPSFEPTRTVLLDQGLQEISFDTIQTSITPVSHISIHDSTYNSLTIDAYTESPGWLVVSEIYYPGWKAYVDEEETPIHKANLALRTIYLNSGNHEVKFIYEPDSFRYGLVLSLAGLLLIIVFIITLLVNRVEKTRVMDD